MSDTKTATKKTKDAFPDYFNRDLSWIEFNRRVLSEALRTEKPLLERLKFLAIVSANFDEFYMIRVASIKRLFESGNSIMCPSGISPARQLQEVRRLIRGIVEKQYRCLLDEIIPKLEKEGIIFHRSGSFSDAQLSWLNRRFQDEIFPVLTPVRFIPGEPYTSYGNIRLHIAFLMEPRPGQPNTEAGERVAVVQIPTSVSRTVYIPEAGDKLGFTFLETIICQFADHLFPGYDVKEHLVFRVTRDADVGVDETRDDDFVEAMEQVINRREHGTVVRMSASRTSKRLLEMLKESLGLEDSEIFEIEQPLDPTGFFEIAGVKGYDHLKFEPWKSIEPLAFPEDESMFEALKRRDVLLNLPYEAFSPVVRFAAEAAVDPKVLAIKMTLYRTSGDSPIVEALELAAQNGKHVTVLVELKARFDEARNISWAERLARAGVIVVYGIAELKVHAKALLVVRKDEFGMKRYLHLSTGNYNDKTARMYSDVCLFTSRDDLCYEAGLFFNAITGYSAIPVLNKLVMAPNALKPRLLSMIDREVQKSSPESPGLIMLKMNSLADTDMIDALYKASASNVEVLLNIRGICMLVPGVSGRSEGIRVVSTIDRYLEHTRAFYFKNGGQEEVWCASADWMPRNLKGRVELMFPIEQDDLKRRVKEMIEAYFEDNTQSWVLSSDGSYHPLQFAEGEDPYQVQKRLYQKAQKLNKTPDLTDKKIFNVRKTPPKA